MFRADTNQGWGSLEFDAQDNATAAIKTAFIDKGIINLGVIFTYQQGSRTVKEHVEYKFNWTDLNQAQLIALSNIITQGDELLKSILPNIIN